MKCLYRAECQATGEPEPPNEIFICPECEKLIIEKAMAAFRLHWKRIARHQNN